MTTVVFSGCATYHPQRLPAAPDLAGSPALTVPVGRMDLPGLHPHSFNPTKGLDETTVITLAVLNNPEIKAARKRAGVAAAQLLEAGLLPDPQVSGGLSRSTLFTGYSLALGEDLRALITRGAAKAAARAHARQVHLAILWQEWQVAQRARELFIQSCANRSLECTLTKMRDLLTARYRAEEAALGPHNVTADTVSAALTALTDVETRLRQLELQRNQTQHALAELLGLKPDVQLRLARGSDAVPGRLLTAAEFQAAVRALPHRRADLLALQAGYASQEQRLREAILIQFPDLSAGVEQARSAEEGVHTVGLTVNLTLPLFNRNRGQIAVQRATRAQLHQAYQARLDQAVNEADQVWRATHIMARQLRMLQEHTAQLERTARAAQPSFREGNLTLADYARLRSNALSAQAEVVRLEASLAQAQAALATLLGLPFGG